MGTVLIGIVLRVRLFATPGHGCWGVSRRLKRRTVAGRLQMLTPMDVGWCTLVSVEPLLQFLAPAATLQLKPTPGKWCALPGLQQRVQQC